MALEVSEASRGPSPRLRYERIHWTYTLVSLLLELKSSEAFPRPRRLRRFLTPPHHTITSNSSTWEWLRNTVLALLYTAVVADEGYLLLRRNLRKSVLLYNRPTRALLRLLWNKGQILGHFVDFKYLVLGLMLFLLADIHESIWWWRLLASMSFLSDGWIRSLFDGLFRHRRVNRLALVPFLYVTPVAAPPDGRGLALAHIELSWLIYINVAKVAMTIERQALRVLFRGTSHVTRVIFLNSVDLLDRRRHDVHWVLILRLLALLLDLKPRNIRSRLLFEAAQQDVIVRLWLSPSLLVANRGEPSRSQSVRKDNTRIWRLQLRLFVFLPRWHLLELRSLQREHMLLAWLAVGVLQEIDNVHLVYLI